MAGSGDADQERINEALVVSQEQGWATGRDVAPAFRAETEAEREPGCQNA
jgi:hypothetical protein